MKRKKDVFIKVFSAFEDGKLLFGCAVGLILSGIYNLFGGIEFIFLGVYLLSFSFCLIAIDEKVIWRKVNETKKGKQENL